MGMAVSTEKDRKRNLHSFVGVIRNDLTVWAISDEARGHELDISGNVYPARHRRAFKLATGHIWYALVSTDGGERSWLVRSTKLYDVRKIESLRWRILLKASAQEAAFDAICERARALGRIWCKNSPHHEGSSFLVWTDKRKRPDRVSPRQLLAGHTNAVDRLAILPTPDEEAIGAEYDEARVRMANYAMRSAMLDEILAVALHVRGVKKTRFEPRFEQEVAARHRITINGRVYYLVGSSQYSTGRESQRVWPMPGDNCVKF